MAKGNLFLGSARGSVGDVTFSVAKGNQVTKRRNRAPQNPRSTSQMVQRLTFSSAALFYKRSVQNLFKFAFEGKNVNQSDYNAFMAENVKLAPTFSKAMLNLEAPAVAPWVMSRGSLQPLGQFFNENGKLAIAWNGDDVIYVDEISRGIIASNPQVQNGDILTFVKVYSAGIAVQKVIEAIAFENWTGYGEEEVGTIGFEIKQMIVDTTNKSVMPAGIFDGNGSTAGNLALNDYIPIEGSEDVPARDKLCNFGICVILSRNTSKGLKVATTALTLSDRSYEGYRVGRNDEWKKWSAQNYNEAPATYADNILQGSIAQANLRKEEGNIVIGFEPALPTSANRIVLTTDADDVLDTVAVGDVIGFIGLADGTGKELSVKTLGRTIQLETSDGAITIDGLREQGKTMELSNTSSLNIAELVIDEQFFLPATPAGNLVNATIPSLPSDADSITLSLSKPVSTYAKATEGEEIGHVVYRISPSSEWTRTPLKVQTVGTSIYAVGMHEGDEAFTITLDRNVSAAVLINTAPFETEEVYLEKALLTY